MWKRTVRVGQPICVTRSPSVLASRNYASQATIKRVNASTGEVVSTVPMHSEADVQQKYKTLRAALTAKDSDLADWRANLSRRKEAMSRFISLLESNNEQAAKALTEDMGKPIKQARGEVKAAKGRVQYFLDNVDAVMADEVIKNEPKLQEIIKWEPLGVVANISAWNYPYFVGSNVFVPALLTGNSVLYKPSEYALATGDTIDRLLKQAGVPEQFFQTVHGDGAVGSMVLDQRVDGVFFTGSVATGKKIYQKAASLPTHMPKVQLELGGKDATYVMPPVDVKSAAESLADGAMYNTGQSCCSVERVYVHESIYDEFVRHFVDTVHSFKVGASMDDDTYIGPLVQDKQRDLLDRHVSDAVKKGAKVLTGGKRRAGKGFYYEPTVLGNCDNSMQVMQEESFGPIVGIAKVSGAEAAIEMINDSAYGLTNGVYTQDKSAAEKILKQVNSGSAYWNCCDRIAFGLPWSGRNLSGVGLTLSTHGIRTFMQPKGYHLSG